MNHKSHPNSSIFRPVNRFTGVTILMALIAMLILAACGKNDSKKTAVAEIPEGLALGSVTVADGQIVNLPMTLKSELPVLGLQFDIAWDTSLVTLGEPVMVASNEFMSIRSKMGAGRSRSLIFNTQSKAMDLTAGEILTIPVTIHSRMVGETPIQLTQVIVAGSNAKQIDLPVLSGKIVLSGSTTP